MKNNYLFILIFTLHANSKLTLIVYAPNIGGLNYNKIKIDSCIEKFYSAKTEYKDAKKDKNYGSAREKLQNKKKAMEVLITSYNSLLNAIEELKNPEGEKKVKEVIKKYMHEQNQKQQQQKKLEKERELQQEQRYKADQELNAELDPARRKDLEKKQKQEFDKEFEKKLNKALRERDEQEQKFNPEPEKQEIELLEGC